VSAVDDIKLKIRLERHDVHVKFHENSSALSDVITGDMKPVCPCKVYKVR
jgi:hypothetical protein